MSEYGHSYHHSDTVYDTGHAGPGYSNLAWWAFALALLSLILIIIGVIVWAVFRGNNCPIWTIINGVTNGTTNFVGNGCNIYQAPIQTGNVVVNITAPSNAIGQMFIINNTANTGTTGSTGMNGNGSTGTRTITITGPTITGTMNNNRPNLVFPGTSGAFIWLSQTSLLRIY